MDEPRTASNLPSLLEEALARSFDADDAARVRAGLSAARERPVTLRANTLRAGRDEVAAALDAAGIAWEPVAWYPDAFVLGDVRERAVWDLPIYQTGGVYLQSLSSMMPPLALGAVPGADVLDMCAAPGGKTSQIAALASNRAHVTACEMKAPRAEKLAYNLDKLGVAGANIMRVDARRLDSFFSFDFILLDAPCTGSGTLRAGDERACRRLTPQLLAKVTRSQQALLDRALTVLKPGGTLVYSTCSILPQENEEQVERMLARHRDCSLVPIAPTGDGDAADAGSNVERPSLARGLAGAVAAGTVPTLPCRLPEALAICPTRLYEGFFMARIVKEGGR